MRPRLGRRSAANGVCISPELFPARTSRKMTPGVYHEVHEPRNLEKQIERQIGCMTGFLQLFDRQQLLAGKRFCSEKRLPSYSAAGSTSPSDRSEFSSASLVKEAPPSLSFPSPEGCPFSPEKHSLTNTPGRQMLPLPVFALKDRQKTSWKLREAPRLSLDSRATVDAKGKLRPREIRISPTVFSEKSSDVSEDTENQYKQRRSPSVVARLMGLEALPDAGEGELPKRAELRRSASESRVPRDLSEFNFHKPALMPSEDLLGPGKIYSSEGRAREIKPKGQKPPAAPLVRKSFFDSQEFFPEPKRTGSLCGEIEKRLRMRGIEEPTKDLETLKQILEALQLKGLLHSKPLEPLDALSVNFLYERRTSSLAAGESPIVVMKPVPKSLPRSPRSDLQNASPRSVSPRSSPAPESALTIMSPRGRPEIDRNVSSPRRQINSRSQKLSEASSPIASPARRQAPLPQRRIPAVHSSKTGTKSLGPPCARSSRNRLPTAAASPKEAVCSPAVDDKSTKSDATIFISPSQLICDRETLDEYRMGRRLLERCDKLLQSIAAITSSAEQVTAAEQQPSPVSVLDSCCLSDESFASPHPNPAAAAAAAAAVDFKDKLADWVDDQWSQQVTSTVGSKSDDGAQEDMAKDLGEDYAYVADVIRESDRHPTAADAFAAIEKRYQSSISSEAHRRLIFDSVTEILERKRLVSPWKAFRVAATGGGGGGGGAGSLLREVWEELQRVQQWVESEDVMALTRGIIRKDMASAAAGQQGWEVAGVEMSEAVLHIERQVFKDLVADTIRELADLACRYRHDSFPRRKLVF
ncbi:Protein LONGIFOLIA 1 [Apostasia shenzhenica]|uniref:Protein LONGIFOLIA 1 n=1 Tax=Apostasia shenzhenica TaxID=1088818 RepID=A0A2I0B0V1_9ASPA|nr:Protein LONGIFOLIA 1 [Apostasia shenzhenica]